MIDSGEANKYRQNSYKLLKNQDFPSSLSPNTTLLQVGVWRNLRRFWSVSNCGDKALPVFYKVDLSDVRNQRGSYGEAFAKHEQVYKGKLEKVLKWRNALTVASRFSGWDSRGR